MYVASLDDLLELYKNPAMQSVILRIGNPTFVFPIVESMWIWFWF